MERTTRDTLYHTVLPKTKGAFSMEKEPVSSQGNDNKKKNEKRTLWIFLLTGLLVAGAFLGACLHQTLNRPESLFHISARKATPTSAAADENPDLPSTPAPTARVAEEETPALVNILLMGIDKEAGVLESYGPTADCHTDALILVAVNFQEKKVDLLSLPRDTFVNMEGVDGFYKLNGILNYGGGKTEAGFRQVCQAAEWMLGGIPVEYYCAIDVDQVAQIGDLLGGVDFDMDMQYTGSSGRRYKKGMQHLDGEGISDYMRARKNATGELGDKGRMNRCKRMLLALFEQLKKEGTLNKIPALMRTLQKGVYTNLTLQQQVALMNFAARLDTETIGMYTMPGEIRSAADWNFMFLDQSGRTELIETLFGLQVEPQSRVSYEYAQWLKKTGFRALKYLRNGAKVLVFSREQADLPEETRSLQAALEDSLLQAQEAFENVGDDLEPGRTAALQKLLGPMRKNTEALAKALSYPEKLTWSVRSDWTMDTDINTVTVDFR